MNWIDKLERKYRKYAIRDLMKYIVGINAFVFVINYLDPTGSIMDKLTLSTYGVLHGEVWRLVTYIFIPPDNSPIIILFILYFYYLIGTSLEHEWGSFRFNLYYLLGMLGTTIAVLLTGGEGTATYLNLSLFLAFAYIYPDYEVLLFFILPVKIKYLGYINWAFIIIQIIMKPFTAKIVVIVSIINYFVFFGKDIIQNFKSGTRAKNSKRKFKAQMPKAALVHKCRVCGLTLKDDPNMDFRYCPECDGLQCYCTEHIKNHEHIKDDKSNVIQFPNNKKEN